MLHSEEAQLIEKLRKIEALFVRPGTEGERNAASNARDRILERLRQIESTERPIEYRFTLPDRWSKLLFLALLRRYGLQPYRYKGQRRTTVRVRVTETFVDEVLWPEFQQLNEVLFTHLQSVTERVVSQAIHGDSSEAVEAGDPPALH